MKEDLKPIERVVLTLEGKETDRVPVCTLSVGCTRLLTGISFKDFSLNGELAAEALILANQTIGDDIIFSFIDLSVEAADFGQEIIYPLNLTAHPNYNKPLIKTSYDYDKLEEVDPTKSPRMSNYLKMTRLLVEKCGKDYPVVSFVYGPLGVLSMMRGTEKLYLDLLEYPEKVKIALEVINEVLKKFTKSQCELGVAGVCVDTLSASFSGVSSELWEEFEGKYVKELGDIIRESGCLVVNHGCGYGPYFKEIKKWLAPIIISFADLPIECNNDLGQLKKTYGQDVVLMGAVSTDILYSKNPKDVIKESWRYIDELGKDGKYILAPGCEFPPNGNIMNARAMVTAAKLYNSNREGGIIQ